MVLGRNEERIIPVALAKQDKTATYIVTPVRGEDQQMIVQLVSSSAGRFLFLAMNEPTCADRTGVLSVRTN